MTHQRILRGVPATLSVTLVDSDGSPRAAVGDVDVIVKRADGTELIASTSADAGSDTGVFTTPLSATETGVLDQLTATWTEQGGGSYDTVVDIVGGYYFSIGEGRRAAPGLQDTQKYPDDLMLKVRQEVEEECERICNRGFVPRFRRVSLEGNGLDRLMLPNVDVRAVKSLTVDGATVAASALTVESYGELRYTAGGTFGYYTRSTLVAAYEYGLDSPPADLKRAALIRFASRLSLSKTGVPDRREWEVIDGKVFGYSKPGNAYPTGIREVDVVYAAHAYDPQVEAAPIR